MMLFTTKYQEIVEKIKHIDPIQYGKSRNFLDGAVTYLSPYISRGVISTKQVFVVMISAGYPLKSIEKLVQELAWRDYWQQIWVAKQSNINHDLKQQQPTAKRVGIPSLIITHQTGIEAIDKGIETFYQTGYLHNHLRMYLSMMSCNVAKCHWKIPAQWMYFHLLDADWASNALSWQWVCGANSHKIYYANQENINKYCYTHQTNTFLDIPYDEFTSMDIPQELSAIETPTFKTTLPETATPTIAPTLPTLIYNFYNLDPTWRANQKANRILLLEPSVFNQYPVSEKSIAFCLALAKENIDGIQVWVAEFDELKALTHGDIYFKEHPLNHYQGTEDARDWMTTLKGYYPSFFAFWKKVEKELSK